MNRSVLPRSWEDEICPVYWFCSAVCLLNCRNIDDFELVLSRCTYTSWTVSLCPTIWYQLNRALSLYQSSRWPHELKNFMSCDSERGTQIYYPCLWKSLGKRILFIFPIVAPFDIDTSLQGFFTFLLLYLYLSPKIPSKESPSTFTSVATDRDITSPQPLLYVSMYTFIHSCYVCRSPQKQPPTYIQEKYAVAVDVATRKRKAYT
jgi:hypothetical protein